MPSTTRTVTEAISHPPNYNKTNEVVNHDVSVFGDSAPAIQPQDPVTKEVHGHAEDVEVIQARSHFQSTEAENRSPKTLELDPKLYPGGIAIWGALPPIYDTSICPPEAGVHVHARLRPGAQKAIDETFDVVTVLYEKGESFQINGSDASSYNISTILDLRVKYLRCPFCQAIHSDQGWHATHYHSEHLCEYCGTVFLDSVPSISNPVMFLKELCGDVLQCREIKDPSERKISVLQSKYPGGIQIWGSNPAILWTSPKLEEGGIHFHGFCTSSTVPTVDETFGTLDIDGMRLDPTMVRILMAQQSLPTVCPQLTSLRCPECNQDHFDRREYAATPHEVHLCEHCGHSFGSERSAVSNPLLAVLTRIREARFTVS